MNLHPATRFRHSRFAGISLIECLVYIAVFALILGLATASFFFCWDHTRAVILATSDIESALRVGDRWRADVRAATGVISIETTPSAQTVVIPEGQKRVQYRFASDGLWRQSSPESASELLLSKVKNSNMQADPRGPVAAWRWDLELAQRRRETHLPLIFTFEAVSPNPP